MRNPDLEKLKIMLPRGAVKEIAEKANVSKSTVYKVLNNERINVKVLSIALDFAKKNDTAKSKLFEELKSL